MVNIQKTVDIQFKNVIYQLSVHVTSAAGQEYLLINLKKSESSDEWVGRHSKEYIQELTKKTGNFKKFGVFVEMLLSTLENEGGPVMLDLLTAQDLKSLKTPKVSDHEKVYLVLTYAVAFDRVHYPIPLIKEVYKNAPTNAIQIDSGQIYDTHQEDISNLKEAMAKQSMKMAKILKENKMLREEIERFKMDNLIKPKPSERNIKIRRQMDSEIKLIERNGGSNMILSSITRLKTLVQQLYQNVGISSRSSSTSSLNRFSPVEKKNYNIYPEDNKQYKVIKSRPLQNPNVKSYNSVYKSRDARSTSGSRERSRNAKPFKRFDPTEYIRSREQSLEAKRRDSRSNSISGLIGLSRNSSPSLRNSRDSLQGTLPRSKSQKSKRTNSKKPREPISTEFLKESNSIDQRLEEIHRILKSTLS